MENKAISKMNKKELYQKCQEQQQEIQKLSLYQEDRDELLNDFDDDNDNLIEEVKKLKETLKFYWSDGRLGTDYTNDVRPDEWNKELDELYEIDDESIICIDCKKYCDMCLSTKNTNGIGYRCMNC